MGNRQSREEGGRREAPSNAESAEPREGTTGGGEASGRALNQGELSALSSGVCRIRQAEKKIGTGFLWRDGWLLTLASVLPTTSDIERATFTFASGKEEGEDSSSGGSKQTSIHFYPHQRLALRKILSPGDGCEPEDFGRDLVFIKLGRQEVPAASEVGTTRLIQSDSKVNKRVPSRRPLLWESTEEDQLAKLAELGVQVTSVDPSEIGFYYGKPSLSCIKFSGSDKFKESGSFRRRSSLRRQARGNSSIVPGAASLSTNLLHSTGFLLYSWSVSESTLVSGAPVVNSSGQLVGVLYIHSSKSEVIGWSGAMAEELSNADVLRHVVRMYGYGKLQEELAKGSLLVGADANDDDAVLNDSSARKVQQDSLREAAVRMEEGAMSKLAGFQFAQHVRLLSFPEPSVRRMSCHRHSMYL